MAAASRVALIPRQRHRCLDGHPWIYRSELPPGTELPHGGPVEVVDMHGRFVGSGLASAHSQIAIRLFTRTAGEAIDADLFHRRLAAALAWRRARWDRPSCRLVSSEADALPGLIVDRYGDALVVQCTTAGMDQRLPLWLDLLREALRPRTIVERDDLAVRAHDRLPQRAGVVDGDAQTRIETAIGDARVRIDLLDPHKTGAYLDQQASHLAMAGWMAGLPAGARVLDVCCHLGGFAIHALRAGAREAIAIDTSAPALALAAEAAALSGATGFVPVQADAFAWLRAASDAGERFDAIVLDPPSFTRTRDAVAGALRGYKELHIRALRMLAPGGMLATFSCSHHIAADAYLAMILDAAGDTGRSLRLIAEPGAAPDHPVLPAVPETRYLKGFVLAAMA